MAWSPADEVGETHPKIGEAKKKLRGYSYGQGLDLTNVYDVGFAAALIEFQTRRNLQILQGKVVGMPPMEVLGRFDWATQKNLGVLDEQLAPPRTALPLVITIHGHMGSMVAGPQYLAARGLEEQGRLRIQMVGYDSTRMPFNNASGVFEADRLVNDSTVLPYGTPWAVSAHSQGSVIFCDWWEQRIKPGMQAGVWPYSHFRGGVNFGNPRRPRGVVAPWVGDPPPPGSEGLDPSPLAEPIPGVAEVSRDGDLYANKTPGEAAEYKEAVYLAVCRGVFYGARNSLAEQMLELSQAFGNPQEIIALFSAIASGVSGLLTLREHGEFDLLPAANHLAKILNT